MSNPNSGAKVRALAAKTIAAVLDGAALDGPLEKYKQGLSDKDQSFLSALTYGCLRRMPRHQAVIKHLLRNPKKPINPMMRALLALGLEQIVATRVPPHAAVSATVAASRYVNQSKGSGFLNAILRRYLREQEQVENQMIDDEQFTHQHHQWMISKIKQDWPDDWQQILEANNGAPPFWIRVNANKTTTTEYLDLLQQNDIESQPSELIDSAILLKQAIDVTRLPNFDRGWVSVQDLGAQLAGPVIDPQPNERILDACAAPGGKAMHILELCPSVQLTALDISADRLERVRQNSQRIGVEAKLIAANAAVVDDWWDGQQFDRILLDAPCTGTGVIRRHPDIKVLRRPSDAAKFSELQSLLLSALWQTLKPGGRMIYATCSIFPEENDAFVAAQLKTLKGAQPASLIAYEKWGKSLKYGVQILPGETGGDGFYYAALLKE